MMRPMAAVRCGWLLSGGDNYLRFASLSHLGGSVCLKSIYFRYRAFVKAGFRPGIERGNRCGFLSLLSTRKVPLLELTLTFHTDDYICFLACGFPKSMTFFLHR